MVAVAIFYAILIFVACASIDQTNGWSFYGAYALLIPALFLFGVWAAIGPGITALRAVVFSLLGPLLVVAAVAGVFTAPTTQNVFFDSELGELKQFCIVFCLSLGICVACQVPFWMFRFVFGWQLIQESRSWTEKKISIRDILLITTIFAFAFAAPRYSAKMYFDATLARIKVGETELFETDDVDADGTPLVFKEVTVTEENIEELREEGKAFYDSYKSGMLTGVMAYSAIVAVLSLLFAPAVFLALRRSGTLKSVCGATLYLLVLFLTVSFLAVSLSSVGGWGQLFLNLIAVAFVFVTAAMFPLLVSRYCGIRLANRRDFRERKLESELVAIAVED